MRPRAGGKVRIYCPVPSGRLCRNKTVPDQGRTSMDKILAACGNDCSACPRYTAHPYEKSEEELHRTAELWMKIGYRDHVVSNEEISCTGCKPENWCRYHIVKCCEEKGIKACSSCQEYPCDNIRECFEVTGSFEPQCRKVCSDREYAVMKKAFFEKEINLLTAQASDRLDHRPFQG